jgi:hypothetical protein
MSLTISSTAEVKRDGILLLKKKLQEFFELSRPIQFPRYPLSLLLYIVRTNAELQTMENELKFLIESANDSCRSFEYRPLLVIPEPSTAGNQTAASIQQLSSSNSSSGSSSSAN